MHLLIKYTPKFYKYILLIIIFIQFILIKNEIEKFISFSKKYKLPKNYYNKHNNFSTSYIKYDEEIFFIASPLNYYFSYKYNILEVKFNIKFYDKNNKIIIPSDLALFYDLHVICHYKYKYETIINSLPDIYKNQYFKCVDYYQLNEKIKFGIRIYKNFYKFFNFYFYSHKSVDYKNNFYKNDDKFNPLIINFNYFHNYKALYDFQNKSNNSFVSLKKLFFSEPFFPVKNKIYLTKNIWHFKNIYNNYFCFCIGNNCKGKICKYKFYLNIIDKNRFLYKKTDYLFGDFLHGSIAPGDAYLVFKEMIKQNLSAYYVTERNDIYKDYIDEKKEYLPVILIKNKQYEVNGDTLEKYLNLFLRLKAVVSGAKFTTIYDIFYNIEYITFICLGHGVNFFKPFLYRPNHYYGSKKYNKIILPSYKIAKIANQYGWTDDNIIIIGLPKWDIFDNYLSNKKMLSRSHKKNKSIFIMFTWRKLKKNIISPYYFKNILKMINNRKLNKELKSHGITLFITLHQNLLRKRNLIKTKKIIKYVKQNDILGCLTNSSLIVSDFSSVIFDLIYQNKPFIIYVPDSNDKNINKLYSQDYLDVINGLKNDSISFKNKFFNINDAINKIIYYINNNFKIEKKIKNFYKTFGFKKNNHNIKKLISYLKSLN